MGRKLTKYEKLGYKAAKRKEHWASCPYQLPKKYQRLVLKRQEWIRGWYEYAFDPRRNNAPKTVEEREKAKKKKHKRH